MKSQLIKSQFKEFTKVFHEHGNEYIITAEVRYDDQCGNRHNTFSITGTIWNSLNGVKVGRDSVSCGCLHEEIAKHFPSLQPFLKWHLVSSEGPMHYVANTIYHASRIEEYNNFVYLCVSKFSIDKLLGIFTEAKIEELKSYFGASNIRVLKEAESTNKEVNIDSARHCACWPDATLAQLQSETELLSRLPKLLKEFQRDIESLGFTF